MTPVTAPLENVNDESVTLNSWLVEDGQWVAEGQPIVEIETGKAAVEIPAPSSGYVRRVAPQGADIPVGDVLCYLNAEPPASAAANGAGAKSHPTDRSDRSARSDPSDRSDPGIETAPAEPAAPPRFSPMARRLVEEHGIDPARFAGRGLIRQSDVQALLNPPAEKQPAPAPAPPTAETPRDRGDGGAAPAMPAGMAPARAEPLSRRKRTEVRQLGAARTHTIPSTVMVACRTRGLRAAARQHPDLNGNVAVILIAEAARLLRRFPALNAYYAGDVAHYYEEVNVGFAVDAGHGLKVPVIRSADRKTPLEVAREMEELLVRYVDDQLPAESLSGATFTLTDLSAEEVFTFVPLISHGQSAILGIGGEFFAPGSPEGLFNLILSFDHQLAEGRQAAQFLKELRDRLAAYEEALGLDHAPRETASCSRCLRPVPELAEMHAYLLPTVQADGSTRPLCTLCLGGF